MQKIEISYRSWFKGIPPQQIKLQIPGWAGTPGYSNGCIPQPWHCKPFTDASTYGLELIYPFSSPCIVHTDHDDNVTFTGDFTTEEQQSGVPMPPFMSFSPHHYGFTSSMDIKTNKDIITRIEPHPRFYTDRSGLVPIPVAGHIETEWWSKIFFVVFKSPLPGQSHHFNPEEPYAQLLFLPKDVDYTINHMTNKEISERIVRDENISKNAKHLCTRHFKDHKGNSFDNKYKTLSKANNKEGVDQYIERVIVENTKSPKKIPGFKRKK